MDAMSAFMAVTSAVSISMAFSRSARVGSAMLTEVAEVGDDGKMLLWSAAAAAAAAVGAWLDAAAVEEDQRVADTRLSRVW
jgi:hypothetical protein